MITAVILIGLGIVVLAYSGIAYKTRGKPVGIGPLHVETTKSHFIPPVVGAVTRITTTKDTALGAYRVSVKGTPKTGVPTSTAFTVKVVAP